MLKIEKLPGKKGDKVVFDQVLVIGEEGKEPQIGTPLVEGAKVEGVIEEQGRAKKVTVIKYKAKVRYRRKLGHKQAYTKVKVGKIII